MIKTLENNINQAISDLTGVKNTMVNMGIEVIDGTPSSEYGDKIQEAHDSINNKITEANDILTSALYGGSNEVTDINRAWWDVVTDCNAKQTYDNLFNGADFNAIGGFNPPYTLKPAYAAYTFYWADGVKKITKEQIDFSSCISFNYCFSTCRDLEEIEEISINSNHMWLFAHDAKLKTIGKLILREGTNFSGNHPFIECHALENIEIEGVIINSVSFRWCSKLTSKSIENIISVLSGTAEGQTLTFNPAVKTTYFNAHSSGYTDAETAWAALVATKPNWTVVL